MCDAPDETSDVWNETERKARVEHTCCACEETIRRGDLYRVTSSLYDGHWQTWAHCLRCAAVVDALHRRDGGISSFAMALDCGIVWEEAPPEIAALAFLTRDEMQARARETQ